MWCPDYPNAENGDTVFYLQDGSRLDIHKILHLLQWEITVISSQV